MRQWASRLMRVPGGGLLLTTGAFALAFLAFTWLVSLERLGNERRNALQNGQAMQENLAGIVAENLGQVLERGQLFAQIASGAVNSTPGRRRAAPTDARQQLLTVLATDRLFSRLALYDAKGELLMHSASFQPGSALQAEVRRFQSDGRHQGSIGPRVPADQGSAPIDPFNVWLVPLLYPVRDHTGALAGTLHLALDLGYLVSLYRQIDIGSGGVIQIFRARPQHFEREVLRARRSGLEVLDASANPVLARLAAVAFPEHGLTAFVPALDLGDGMPYQTCLHRVGDLPFIVAVSRPHDELLAAYRLIERNEWIRSLSLTLLLLVAAGLILASLRRRLQTFRALQLSEARNQSLIEQLRHEKQRAIDLAYIDHLTGLPNRRMFAELAGSHLARARRLSQRQAVLFLDLDRFKPVNDTWGHAVGDALLKSVALRLRACLRESDIVARFGGDEFVLLLTQDESASDIGGVAAKVIAAISEPCTGLCPQTLTVGTSVGIALYPEHGGDVEQLIRRADAAMYQAKEQGRGAYCFYDPGQQRMRHPEEDFADLSSLPEAP